MRDLVERIRAAVAVEEHLALAADNRESDWWWGPDAASAAERHIARQDPKRVLRRIATYRRILDRHIVMDYRVDRNGRIEHLCTLCCWTPEEHIWDDGPACDAVMMIAEDYGLVDAPTDAT